MTTTTKPKGTFRMPLPSLQSVLLQGMPSAQVWQEHSEDQQTSSGNNYRHNFIAWHRTPFKLLATLLCSPQKCVSPSPGAPTAMQKLLFALLSFVAHTLAQEFAFRSPRFNLIYLSDDLVLNGTLASTCHEGAAIDGLCGTNASVLPSLVERQVFTHNTSDEFKGIPNPDFPGALSWTWLLGSNKTVESVMAFQYTPSSNVAPLNFMPKDPGTATAVSFDPCNNMYIQRAIDDTVVPPPPASGDQSTSRLLMKDYHWYICQDVDRYRYMALSWKVGAFGRPQNPTCKKVLVKRVFLDS
ncbi:hypothetical protein K491DRAFT_16300 [Lophiostoma macrostomum CBS 122681]|uniref:Uncharacterized protein n=1 Tax=Lophiostoma macrostomum CBS 122681 TaxID=1314788 RepID=A0A6A6TPC3_9PLEO|nr:hypothetical protein K491DRAFT_16300 [Lophiostoma macrostomum CBS 122681]